MTHFVDMIGARRGERMGVDVADGVEIDTDQVVDFGRDLRVQADKGFSSAAGRGADLHGHGVVFGAAIPGGAVLEAKQRYAQALEMTEANLRAYKQAAIVFAEVAEQIAQDFSAADMSSKEAQQKVMALMADAIAKANQALGTASGSGS